MADHGVLPCVLIIQVFAVCLESAGDYMIVRFMLGYTLAGDQLRTGQVPARNVLGVIRGSNNSSSGAWCHVFTKELHNT